MWEGEEQGKGGRGNSEEVFSLTAVVIICSSVITALGGGCLDPDHRWSSCRSNSSHLRKLSLIKGRREEEEARKEQHRREGWRGELLAMEGRSERVKRNHEEENNIR